MGASVENDGFVRVGSVVVRHGVEGTRLEELLAVFRDDMFAAPGGQPHSEEAAGPGTAELAELRANGRVVADRLDVMGLDAPQITADLDEMLQSEANGLLDETFLAEYPDVREEGDFLRSMTGRDWVERLAVTPDDPSLEFDKRLGGRYWLMELINDWDDRRRLRAVLLAFPDADVVADLSWWDEDGWLACGPSSLASTCQLITRRTAATYAPMVVLTEGKTDAEFLAAALAVLYPHLTDLVRFLDYERKPEGGVGALMHTVRAFAAAGIANRVVAICDNDAAAADGLRKLSRTGLPANIRVMQYPELDLAKAYPTLGPPTLHSNSGSVALANVNGAAASIELYLGRDVLKADGGKFYSVQWTSYIPALGRYQGEVTRKEEIHTAFRAKAELALASPEVVSSQDWEGLRLILQELLSAFSLKLA